MKTNIFKLNGYNTVITQENRDIPLVKGDFTGVFGRRINTKVNR